MATPRAVKQQADKANKLVEAMKAGGETPAPPVEEPPVHPAPSPAPVGDPPLSQSAVVTPAANGAAQAAQPPPEVEDYKHMYKVLQGKYNAEVPRLSRQVAELASRSEQLEELLARLSAASSAPAVPTTPAGAPSVATPTVQNITAEEMQEWGPEFFNVVERHVKLSLEPMFHRLEGRINALEGGVVTVTRKAAQSDRERLYQHLDTNVDGWRELNVREDFLEWLNRRDPYAGRLRGVLLKDAFEANDGERVAQFFTGFLREHATVTPSGNPTSVTPSAPTQGGNGRVDLASLTAPGRPAASAPTNPQGAQQKRLWTSAEISAFYNDVRKGVFKNREQERMELERDIVAAPAEGRLR